MNARFHVPGAQATGQLVELPEEEAAHVTRVLRLGSGDTVRVFNGAGLEFEAVVERASRSTVAVRVGAPRTPAPEPRIQVTLAQAVLKADKMDDVVRDAVMMGAVAIQPLVSARCEIGMAALERGRRRERWERIAVASVKQCGRAVVPRILAPLSFQSWGPPSGGPSATRIPSAGAAAPELLLMLVEPAAAADVRTLSSAELPIPERATLIVGPEGGWTPDEVRHASTLGAQFLALGGRTLRADAMPIVALAALFSRWNEL